jgi:hypothetical protein
VIAGERRLGFECGDVPLFGLELLDAISHALEPLQGRLWGA